MSGQARASMIAIAIPLAGCNLVTHFDDYHRDDGDASTTMDGRIVDGARQPDAPAVDVGPIDAPLIACSRPEDCGPVMMGAWTDCAFTDGCAEGGTHARTIRTPRCSEGHTCTFDETMEMEACARETDGTMCGATTWSGWGACSYTPCAPAGSRTQTRTEYYCAAGACTPQLFGEVDTSGCVRGDQEHQGCGADWRYRCCGGECVDIRVDTRHCGGCGLGCAGGRVCGDRLGLPSCTCGANSECVTARCSTTDYVCTCQADVGGVCFAPMTCHVFAGGADVCTYP